MDGPHLRWTIPGPDSSYSSLVIHMVWKVDRDDRMEPPIHTEYFLSGGAMILIFRVEGARAVISFCIRSAIPAYMVVPPDMTMLAKRSFLMSMSHFMMETSRFHTKEGRLEEGLRSTETFIANGDDLTVRKFIGLVNRCGCSSNIHLSLKVKSDEAK